MTRAARIPLGAWPRGLSAEQAAAYVGVARNKFLAEVDEGLWPDAERRGGRVIWDRAQIDEAWDRQHQSEADPFMEAINGGR
jgi:hypothetical protein